MGPNFDVRMQEKLEVLDGSRAGPKDQAAVRLSDLEQLLSLAEVKTAGLTTSPTAADFNSLLDDLKAISNAVRAVGNALRQRRSR
ncbi:hypothetical protein [Rhizobium sp. 18065]|uniref:hypothetical protein n=1 Tax=Rhizobium sp. 18065 TaxID=2681411 RepID=UPI001357606A|nr:hypothetical protein [Rhizobium sp. 18065]